MVIDFELDTSKIARLIAVVEEAKALTSSRKLFEDAKLFHKFLTELLSDPHRSIELTDDPEE